MASKTLAPVADHQQQDEQSIEETNKSMTKNLLFSGVQNLATFDESLTQQEETQLMTATKGTLGETVDPAVKVGQELRGVADKIDGILNKKVINGSIDHYEEMLMKMVGEIVKNEISKGTVMTVLIAAYAFIRNYLKRYSKENILNFIESMAKWLYEAFVKFGVMNWILNIGGWIILESTSGLIMNKLHWAIIGSVGLLLTGVGAYNFYYA